MLRHDILSDVFSIIKNGEKSGKLEVYVPASNLVKSVLLVLQKENYIGEFEFIDDKRGGKFKIQLLKKINECNSIRPRISVKNKDIIKYEKRYLPSVNTGIIIISTSKGVMTHNQAKEANLGGKLLGYVY
ncbi:MAG: 30S ribosomal protein S8 [Candidatus Aenigmatarchaeota archaeon]|nr:30S ribosomal protein S8 [Candidatus Aenigmarchaeota archaeon]